jgi:N-methylhydantoinase A/oxoprolinase/acetone carboxylase beta subunit
MSLSLGLDTGGTYTDAVIFDAGAGTVAAKAKALTTRHDLAIGIAEAAGKALDAADTDPGAIGLVSVSTTLATNALVEGQGGRVALVMVGFGEADLDRAGLREALGDDPVLFLPGGHDIHGRANPLDLTRLESEIDRLGADVSAFAVAGYFAVRNPEHEIAVRDLIATRTDRAATCSHELSSKLDGPRRALTTVLNARLIGLITRLIAATRGFLEERGIAAPLMVVRGDGSLVSADFAALRPIETILSGPAASVVGARFLTGRDDGYVADIGGTTTDIAILEAGRPRLDPAGAEVGGHRTMVEAIDVHTFGLGGDSEIHVEDGALDPVLRLGPRRLLPLSLLEMLFPNQIVPHLKRQIDASFSGRLDGRFAVRAGLPEDQCRGLSRSQADLFARIGDEPVPLDRLLRSTSEVATLDRLAARGLVLVAGFTPTDAGHVEGRFSHWHKSAAELGAALFARRKDGRGRPLAISPAELARNVADRLNRLSAERVLETGLAADGLADPRLLASPLVRRALDRSGHFVRTALLLDRPVIGLGAGAASVYPGAGALLATEAVIPDHADVANAIGAVAGQVRVSATAEITPDEQGEGFVVSGAGIEPTRQMHRSEESALKAAEAACRAAVSAKAAAAAAGAGGAEIDVHSDIRAVTLDDRRQFVSATVTATATGRPAVA